MEFVNFNGDILPADSPLFSADNRGWRYGDGLFETMRYCNGGIPFLPTHIQRLKAGMKLLGMEIPAHFLIPFFEKEINKVLPGSGNTRLRLAVIRKAGGQYAPETNAVDFLIQPSPLLDSPVAIPQSGVLHGFPVIPSPWSCFKTANSLPYILASRARKQAGWEEAVLLNPAGRVADGCHSNIFAVINGHLHTPPVTEGALAGVIRSWVIEKAGKRAVLLPIKPEDLEKASEVWFTNAVQGIRWVEKMYDRPLENRLWHEFFSALNGLWNHGNSVSAPWINQ